MKALEIAAIGLQQDGERLKVIGHNVANLTTPGFKRQMSVQAAYFADVLDAARLSQDSLSVHTDGRAGKLRATGNALDLVLGESEYLVVQLADQSQVVTRQASLQTDPTGRLVTASGAAVQGASGDITIPRTAQSVRVDAAGNVLADEVLVGTLSIVRVESQSELQALGDGVFRLAVGTSLNPMKPTNIRSGHLEASNVVPSQEMVHLMTTTRHAESMVRLIQGADEMLEKAIRKFGEL
jgi:flagellar basal-body rod protein FlgF